MALLGLVLLGAGIWLGGHPGALPGTVRDALVADSDSRLYDETLDLIEEDYYRRVDRRTLVNRSLDAAVSSLGDRFSDYFDPATYRQFEESTSGEFSGVGLSVEEVRRGLRVVQVFAGSPARRQGIRAGEIIVAVDGRSIAGRSSKASTALIKGRPGTSVRLTLEGPGDQRRIERVRRARVEVPVVSARTERAGGEKVAYARLASFTSGAHGELGQAIRSRLKAGAKGVVLDLRDNGGGLLDEAVLVSSLFIDEGTVVSTRGRNRPRRVFSATGGAIDSGTPVVVLVNRGSASASEIVTGALQDRDRGTVVGTNTFGKGVFQEVKRLSNGGALDITVGEYFTPKGRNVGGGGVKQGRGLTPDVRARDDRSTKRDEALDAALRTLGAGLR